MKTILIILTLMVPFICSAQTGLSGIVKMDKTNQPIAYCHVYINEYIGTVTNENGEFLLVIPEKFVGLELHISHVGYKSLSLSANDLKNKENIVMEQAVIMLPEVVISPDPWIMFQESVNKIVSATNDQTDENIYNAILDELEKMKPPFEAFYSTTEKSNHK